MRSRLINIQRLERVEDKTNEIQGTKPLHCLGIELKSNDMICEEKIPKPGQITISVALAHQ